jgi:hypothetical protein
MSHVRLRLVSARCSRGCEACRHRRWGREQATRRVCAARGFDGEVTTSAPTRTDLATVLTSKEFSERRGGRPPFFFTTRRVQEAANRASAWHKSQTGRYPNASLILQGRRGVPFDALSWVWWNSWPLPGVPGDNVLDPALAAQPGHSPGAASAPRQAPTVRASSALEGRASARLMGKEVLLVEAAPVPLSRALGQRWEGITRRFTGPKASTSDWHQS